MSEIKNYININKGKFLSDGLNSEAIHFPNEQYGIFNPLKGIETIPLFYKYFTELSNQ